MPLGVGPLDIPAAEFCSAQLTSLVEVFRELLPVQSPMAPYFPPSWAQGRVSSFVLDKVRGEDPGLASLIPYISWAPLGAKRCPLME